MRDKRRRLRSSILKDIGLLLCLHAFIIDSDYQNRRIICLWIVPPNRWFWHKGLYNWKDIFVCRGEAISNTWRKSSKKWKGKRNKISNQLETKRKTDCLKNCWSFQTRNLWIWPFMKWRKILCLWCEWVGFCQVKR